MIFENLQLFFNTFGSYILVPIVIFIIALIFKAPVNKAFSSAVQVGVGLMGMSFITSAFGSELTPLVQQMVEVVGIDLPAVDIGWQAIASVAYSTEIGMIYLGVGLVFQILLVVVRVTDIFMPSDLWNNYSIIVWGSMYYHITGNFIGAMLLMMFINLVVLLIAEVIQKRWSTYYGYPGTAMTAPHHMGDAPMYLILDRVLSRVGVDKVDLRPEVIKKRIGFLGEPMYMGLIVGLFVGILGNLNRLLTLEAWGQIAAVAVTASAVMTIFPRIAGIFAGGFSTLTDYSRKFLKNSKGGKDRDFVIAVNDALGYGEEATLTTGLLVIPIALLLAFIVPGNLVVPIMVLPALPYMVEVPVSLSNGNIFKSTIAATIVFAAKLLMASSWTVVFTQIAESVGFDVTSGATTGVFIIGFILSNVTAGLITYAFISGNPLIIGITVVIYLAAFIFFRKNKEKIHDYLEANALNLERATVPKTDPKIIE